VKVGDINKRPIPMTNIPLANVIATRNNAWWIQSSIVWRSLRPGGLYLKFSNPKDSF
jgi:hypothetical protein